MASPVDAGRATTNITTSTTPWTVNLPGSIAAGDLLIAYVRYGGAQTASWSDPAVWTTIFNIGSPDASDDNFEVRALIASGSEGSTFSLSVVGGAKGAAIVWKITGASSVVSGSTAPEASSATVGTAANINPASFTPASPGGSQDYLWLSLVGMDSETATASNGTLSNVVSANSGTGGAVATNCIIWGGSKQTTASSEDTAAWTSSAPANGVSAVTIAIYPAAPPDFIPRYPAANHSATAIL